MARRNLNRENLPGFIARVASLRVDTPRQWGKMDAAHMVQHLIFMTETSLGLRQVEDRSVPVFRVFIWWFAFNWMTTWPKGKLKSFAFALPEPAGDFPAQQAALIRSMEDFVKALEAAPDRRALSPLLGMITIKQWSRVHGVHNDHHLRQFGV